MREVKLFTEIKEANLYRSTNTDPVLYKIIITGTGLKNDLEYLRDRLLNKGLNKKDLYETTPEEFEAMKNNPYSKHYQ